jgi:molybdopterin-containing oxidoreductase family iron-sulfur binding subunit
MAQQKGKEARPDQAPPGRRRAFLQALAGIGAGAAVAGVGLEVLSSESAKAAEIPPPLAESTGTALIRMQQDLERVLASGKTPSWMMIVDTRKCIGCNACTVACKAEVPTGPGGFARRVIQKELPVGPRPYAIFKPVNCLQCDDPPCAKAVPAGMIRKRPDGIVEFDHSSLTGPYAQAAARACPWNLIHVDSGATYTQNTPNPQPYEDRTFEEYGRTVSRKKGSVDLLDRARKCTFCAHRLDQGVLPACVTTCIGGAMYFGDMSDTGSLVYQITQGRRVFRGHQDTGVKPRVIYFEESMPGAVHVDCEACHGR